MTDATLTLARKTLGVQRRPFDVLVDHTLAATIDYGKAIDLRLVPGPHSLQISSGRLTSPETPFDAHDGEAIAFRCRGALLWPIYVAALLKPDLGVTLKRESA
jgi:hypothetical protein